MLGQLGHCLSAGNELSLTLSSSPNSSRGHAPLLSDQDGLIFTAWQRRTEDRPVSVEDVSGRVLVALDAGLAAGPDGTVWTLIRKPPIGRLQHVDGLGAGAGRVRLAVGPSNYLAWSLGHPVNILPASRGPPP
jgi:hypothetical protein